MGPAILVGGQPRPYPVSVFAMKDTQGLKLGVRVGMTYTLRQHLHAFIAVQVAEAAGGVVVSPVKNPDGTYSTGYTNHGSVNPSWLETSLRWCF